MVAGVPAFWPLPGSIFVMALMRVGWLGMRDRRPPWRGHGAVALFLLLVGLQAGIGYVLTRCGSLEITTIRYALLMLYAGVGVVALYFIYETRPVLRHGMVAVMLIWTALTAASHLRLMREYLYREPRAPHRDLAVYLVNQRIHYARSDYWTAYATTFLANEHTVFASTDTVRITQYQRDVDAHRDEAVTVRRGPCPAGTGAEVVPGTYWVCPP